jgi:predicted RNase H-like HicB family nuclease
MRTYTMVAEPEDGGGYFVTVPALPGCFTRGSTIGGQLGSGG